MAGKPEDPSAAGKAPEHSQAGGKPKATQTGSADAETQAAERRAELEAEAEEQLERDKEMREAEAKAAEGEPLGGATVERAVGMAFTPDQLDQISEGEYPTAKQVSGDEAAKLKEQAAKGELPK
jgi:hypothetical protein